MDQQQFIENFEKGLVPDHLDESRVKARILGYGEISTVFEIAEMRDKACKRMPLFNSRKAAETYQLKYNRYCQYLSNAGISVAESQTRIVALAGKPVTLYIIQEKLSEHNFVNKLIRSLTDQSALELIHSIVLEILKVQEYNMQNASNVELALDGQLSNWALEGDRIIYIDTSTPLFKLKGKEQLDPELFLKSAPSFLRWIIRAYFLKGVMERYYDLRMILLDLVANMYKEKRDDLIPEGLLIINKLTEGTFSPITSGEVAAYYKEDKMIWRVFLSFRRLDKWIKTRLLRQNYPYILPGKIRR